MMNVNDLAVDSKAATLAQKTGLAEIDRLDRALLEHFKRNFVVETSLTRQLVSFQANKSRASYRWYKYKEAFSASLVEYLLGRYGITSGKILDPFAGSGTTLFAASERGLQADGIELLPVGQQIIAARLCIDRDFTSQDFAALERWLGERPWKLTSVRTSLPELRITQGAYPGETMDAIERFMGAWQRENTRVQLVLRFILLSVLESISYTRKDGQYLRWDYRSGRRQGEQPFDKGIILDFDQAVSHKIKDVLSDVEGSKTQTDLFSAHYNPGEVRVLNGSCLDVMPTLAANLYDSVVTSPPYCNRYDYTRTYALELALLGMNHQGVIDLRQQMLSCTVENRAKDLLSMNPAWADTIQAADQQDLLQAVLQYLESQKAEGALNNNGIPRMVRGYFYEMACIIAECHRVMKSNSLMFMVNDNVRYAGASISVDMILSHVAERLGFHIENILVLPNGKGNSSQQMGVHGRDNLRKCVYVWRKI